MKTSASRLLTLISILTLAACGDSGDGAGGAGAPGSGGDTAGGANAGGDGTGGADGADWQALLESDWELGAFSENPNDLHTLTLDRDIFIGAIRPISPEGTHHTVLMIGDPSTANIIYASGVGTDELVFPDGVGLKVAAGETLVMQLHLFNPSGDPISGTSGVEIRELAPESVEQEADIYMPGPLGFEIPPMQSYTDTGTCIVQVPQTYFAMIPHMHQLGTHFKTTLMIDGEPTVIHDDAFGFDEQAFTKFEPITLSVGDSIATECTWDNTTSETVVWGSGSDTEMCFSILYRYPKVTDATFCDE